jgi:hypothetical protein
MAYEDEDDDFGMDAEDLPDGEQRRELENRHKNARQHPLAVHNMEIANTLLVLLKYPKTEDDYITSHIELIQESFNMIKVKLYSALRSGSYIVCMQNASIIRHHADYLLLASHTLNSLNCFDKGHVSVFRDEMEEFQQLFKAWAKEIKEMDKEDFEDEWGLF